MKVILRASTSNPNCGSYCDFALIDLTPEFATEAVRRIVRLREEQANDRSLHLKHHWSHEVRFFDSTSLEDSKGIAERELLAAARRMDAEGEDSTMVPEHASLNEEIETHVDLAQLIVREADISFYAAERSGAWIVTTVTLPKRLLESASDNAIPINKYHSHAWKFDNRPAEHVTEEICACGAERHVIVDSTELGTTTTIRIFEPAREESTEQGDDNLRQLQGPTQKAESENGN